MTAHKSTGLPVIHKSDDFFATFDHMQEMIRERADHIFHERIYNFLKEELRVRK